MATKTQNNVNFSTVKTSGVKLSTWPIYLNGQQGPDEDGGVINAVDIDWNGANLSARKEAINSTGIPDTVALPTSLNTTGELLDIIAQQQAQIDALILMVKGLYVGLAATN